VELANRPLVRCAQMRAADDSTVTPIIHCERCPGNRLSGNQKAWGSMRGGLDGIHIAMAVIHNMDCIISLKKYTRDSVTYLFENLKS
jgi:predicted metal-binding protein